MRMIAVVGPCGSARCWVRDREVAVDVHRRAAPAQGENGVAKAPHLGDGVLIVQAGFFKAVASALSTSDHL